MISPLPPSLIPLTFPPPRCPAGVRCSISVEVRDKWGNRRLLEEDNGPNCHARGLLADCVPVSGGPQTGSSCLDPATGIPGENSAREVWQKSPGSRAERGSDACGQVSFGSFLMILTPDARPQAQGRLGVEGRRDGTGVKGGRQGGAPSAQKQQRLLLTAANVYSGGYNVTEAGLWTVSVVWDSTTADERPLSGVTDATGPQLQHVRNSPFRVRIVPGQTVSENSVLSGRYVHINICAC